MSAVGDGITDACLLAFELIPESAGRTFVIAGRMARLQPGQFGRRTIGTEKILLTSSLRNDPRPLRAAGICGGE